MVEGPKCSPWLKRIVSGQTGADRGAFDAAIACGIEYGGWCPRGRLAEDGTIPDWCQNVSETDSAQYPVRTEKNVIDSDGTLIFHSREPHGKGCGDGCVGKGSSHDTTKDYCCVPEQPHNNLFGGTAYTLEMAKHHHKPYFIVNAREFDLSVRDGVHDVKSVRQWISDHRIRVLNCAGPRESDCPGIHAQTFRLLQEMLRSE